jgi:hypothetical protein
MLLLTKTQLRAAKTKELERLRARIEKELESRIEADLENKRQRERERTEGKEQLFYSGHSGTYRWEYVACGHSERCRKCQSGKKHGPYLYRYFYKDEKQKSEYIRLSDVHLHPDAPVRPV